MAQWFKGVLIGGIVIMFITFLIAGVYFTENNASQINSLDNRLSLAEKKKEYYSSQIISLAAVRTNLETQIEMSQDAAKQIAMQNQLNSLNDAALQQQLLAQQQQQAALQQQQLQQQQAAKIVTKTTTTKTRTRAS